LSRIACALLFSLTSAVAVCLHADELEGETDAAKPDPSSAPAAAGVTLLDGRVVPGRLRGVSKDGLLIGTQKVPIPTYEVQEIRTGSVVKKGGAGKDVPFHRHPLVRFRTGDQIAARVLDLPDDGPRKNVARIRLVAEHGAGPQPLEIDVPLAQIAGFRLREAHPSDGLLERDLAATPPEVDTLYLRRQGLFRFRRPFRAVEAERVFVEDSGRRRAIKRQMIQGLVLAPVASTRQEPDPSATFDLPGVGRLPAYLVGFERSDDVEYLVIRLPGSPPDSRQRLPISAVRRISPASDRVLFLSAAEPTLVDEAPVLGAPLRYRKDRSVNGGPLRMAGRRYRRGLGVHSRSVLEFALAGQYASFATVIGLDESSRGKGGVTFRVLADGKELFAKNMTSSDQPQPVSLPMDGVEVLRLEVGYGPDGLDFSDHANWADARVTK